MPLYEYRCEACGAKEEKLQSFSAPTVHDCPKCGVAEAMHREISRTAFVLSGSGWYANGYSEGSQAPSKAGSATEVSAKPENGTGEAASAPIVGDSAESKSETISEAKTACASGCACHSPKIKALTEEA